MIRLLTLLYPRRCPFCDRILPDDAPQAAFCPQCAGEERRLRHEPPRLPDTEHDFYALSGAGAAYYYADGVRTAILRCKLHDRPWYAQELTDRLAVCLWGAQPARRPGERPVLEPSQLPRFHMIVPVPARVRTPGLPGLPLMAARRLGVLMGVPVAEALTLTRPIRPQKELDRAQRIENVKGAYAARRGAELEGRRVLLVDDVITTGSTASACALALLEGGAQDVFAACIAAQEELPKEKQRK